jgi:hypothetical protein
MNYNFIYLITVIGLILVSGCIQENKAVPQMALSPFIEFEATVISISLEPKENYFEGNNLLRAPKDFAIIRIDSIINSGGDSDFDWSSIGFEEGKTVSLEFKYTLRPAKIITIPGKTTYHGDTVSYELIPSTVSFENNYFIFTETGNSETETILPGLQEGNKFKTTLWKTFELKAEKYELI